MDQTGLNSMEEGSKKSWWEGKQGLRAGLRKQLWTALRAALESLLNMPSVPLFHRQCSEKSEVIWQIRWDELGAPAW